jgi:hypothetical protein
LHGELMVVGGIMFGLWARLVALMLFLVGIAMNLVLGCLAAPDILQVVSRRRAQPRPDDDGPSYPAQARPGSPAALISAQLPRKLACGRGSPPIPRQSMRDLQVV